MNKLKNLDELKRLIRNSYGIMDLIFANHPNEISSTIDSLLEVKKNEIGYSEYIDLHEEFLKNKNVSAAHLKKQIEKVKKFDSYFLYN